MRRIVYLSSRALDKLDSLGSWWRLIMRLLALKWTLTAAMLFYHNQLTGTAKLLQISANNSTLSYLRVVELERSAASVYELILAVGCSRRETGIAGVFCCSVYGFLLLIRVTTRRVWRKTLDASSGTGIMGFLMDPERESQQLASRIKDIIREIQDSNKFYTGILCKSILSTGARATSSELVAAKSSRLSLKQPLSCPLRLNQPSSQGKSEVFKYSSTGRSAANCFDDLVVMRKRGSAEDLLFEMSDQRKHLDGLVGNVSLVWPENREIHWHKLLLRYWILAHVISFLLFWTAAITSVSLSFLLARHDLERAEHLPVEYRGHTHLERIDDSLQLIVVNYTTRWLAVPTASLVMFSLDQMKHLAAIKVRLQKLNEDMIFIKQSYCSSTRHQHSSAIEVMPDGGRRIRRDLRLKYDSEAIELYLILRIFTKELRSMFSIGECYIVAVYCSMGCIALMMVSLAYKVGHLDSWLKTIFGGFSFLVVLFVNVALYPCAALNHQCIETTRLAWSLLANAEQFRLLDEAESQESEPETPYRVRTVVHVDTNSTASLRDDQLEVDLHSRLINPHTSLLWRRFIGDFESLDDSLSCRLFGLIRLNFSTVIRLNFWAFSVIAVVLSTYY